jgi:hypothetical protein
MMLGAGQILTPVKDTITLGDDHTQLPCWAVAGPLPHLGDDRGGPHQVGDGPIHGREGWERPRFQLGATHGRNSALLLAFKPRSARAAKSAALPRAETER